MTAIDLPGIAKKLAGLSIQDYIDALEVDDDDRRID